jgi:hypothetical protein
MFLAVVVVSPQKKFKEKLSVWHCERIGYERQSELDLKKNMTDSGLVLNKSSGQLFLSTICYRIACDIS